MLKIAPKSPRMPKASFKVALYLLTLLIAQILILGLYATPVIADTQQNTTEWEYNETGNASFETYNKVIAAQTFTPAITHEVSTIGIYGFTEGDPSYIKIQLETVNSSTGKPTGHLVYDWLSTESHVSVSSAYFTGNEDGSWIMCTLDHGAKLESGTMYAIVVSAPAGDSGNSYSWEYDNGGNSSNTAGMKWTSTNGGKTWTEDTNSDFMFQTWGASGLEIHSVNVYSSFHETDDWLVVCSYLNKAPTYYKDDDIEQYFRLQLVENVSGNVTGETVLRSWDAAVASIYLNAEDAAVLQWEGNFTLRIMATYGGNWYVDHDIASSEWIGDTLTFLDKWSISQSRWMGTINKNDDEYYITDTTLGNAINSKGIKLFELGIPLLGSTRGEYIYETYMSEADMDMSGSEDPQLQNRYDWRVQLGTAFSDALDDIGSPFNLSGKEIGLMAMVALYVFVVGASFPAGHSTAGAAIGYVVVLIGMVAGVVDVVWMILAFAAAYALGLRQLILTST